MNHIHTSIGRIAKDAAAGLAIYMVLAVGLLGAPSFGESTWGNAHAAGLGRVKVFTGPMADAGSTVALTVHSPLLVPRSSTKPSTAHVGTVVALGAVFAALFAFNLAFFRHLRRVYVAPRSRRVRVVR